MADGATDYRGRTSRLVEQVTTYDWSRTTTRVGREYAWVLVAAAKPA